MPRLGTKPTNTTKIRYADAKVIAQRQREPFGTGFPEPAAKPRKPQKHDSTIEYPHNLAGTTRRYCQHHRPVCGMNLPCGRPACSVESYLFWAKPISYALQKSFTEKPPDLFARITPLSHWDQKQKHRVYQNFFRKLRTAGIPFLWVRQFTKPGPADWDEPEHLHLTLITREGSLSQVDLGQQARWVRQCWRSCFPARDHDCWNRTLAYAEEVQNPIAIARYITQEAGKRTRAIVIPPTWFTGRLIGTSQGMLTKPLNQLVKEVKADWRAKRGPADDEQEWSDWYQQKQKEMEEQHERHRRHRQSRGHR